MSPIQQMLLGVGAVATKTYIDDIFSTYVYTGNGSARSINNGIDLSGEGGMVWIKKRNSSTGGNSHIADTARGITKYLTSNENYAELTDANRTSATTSQGFSLGTVTTVNNNNDTYASWSFRKAPGFFDVVTYTGTGAQNLQISHNLGCVPGMVLIKNLSSTDDWFVYHRETNAGTTNARGHYGLTLNSNAARDSSQGDINYYEPTSEHFRLGYEGHGSRTNTDGDNYVAYLFAGGESTAATARSVDFDGNGDTLFAPNSSDYSFGSGDFTVEGWFRIDQQSSQNGIIGVWGYSATRRSWLIQTDNSADGPLEFFISSDGGNSNMTSCSGGKVSLGQWYHFAAVRTGNTLKLFLNGIEVATSSFSGSLYNNTNDNLHIGSVFDQTDFTNGKISNIRITKGQALYTSSFKVTTEPLTTTSQGATANNVKLLCCNNSSVTGATVSSGTMTTSGDPTASTDSPFDDPAGFVFGDAEDQNVIKCGSYVGNGSATGPEIFLGNGWEPQWVMLKRTDATGNWFMHDSMRGIATGGNDPYIMADTNDQEAGGYDLLDLTSTGFKLNTDSSAYNASGGSYIFCAIRRPDGYVGKPPSLGTDVFAMDYGNGLSVIPVFDSGFPVDFSLNKKWQDPSNWEVGSRLIQGKYLLTNSTNAEATFADFAYDSNAGWNSHNGYDSNWLSWMWKRHAGFDVVAWDGTNSSVVRRHNLGRTPEMIIYKSRSSTRNWRVYHIGLNGGTNPEDYAISLNSDSAESSNTNYMTSTAPTATHFVSGNDDDTNGSGKTYIALLFASISGISAVGSYTGNGTSGSSTQTISTGFAPRFLIIKNITESNNWFVLDTTRGWASGNDQLLLLDSNSAQVASDFGVPTSSGFTLTGDSGAFNENNKNYIYYAHA